MLDIGWPEFFVILVIALVVIGPKDLPKALYTVGKWVRSARKVTGDFQRHIDDMVREAELEDVKKGVQKARSFNIKSQVEKAIDPTGDLRTALDDKKEGKAPATAEGSSNKTDEAAELEDAKPAAKAPAAPAPNASASSRSRKTTSAKTTSGSAAKAKKSPSSKSASAAKAGSRTSSKTNGAAKAGKGGSSSATRPAGTGGTSGATTRKNTTTPRKSTTAESKAGDGARPGTTTG